jgi:hypothetical protein
MLEQAGTPGPLAPAGHPAEGTAPPQRVAPEAHEHATPPRAVYPEQGQWATPPPGRLERLAMAAWTKPKWLAPVAVLGCVGAAFTYVLQNNPADAQADPLGPCAFKLLTGFDCPGCGGTRMVWYLLHGNVLEAARYHFVALLAVPVLAWAYIVWAVFRFTGKKLPSKSIPLPLILGYLVFWFVFAVLRNLPWAPFDWFYVS